MRASACRGGVRVRHDLLAAAARLAGGGRLGTAAQGAARPVGGGGSHPLRPRCAGQHRCSGKKGGVETQGRTRWTGAGWASSATWSLTPKNPLLSSTIRRANRHHSKMLEATLDAVPPVSGGRRRLPRKLHAVQGLCWAPCSEGATPTRHHTRHRASRHRQQVPRAPSPGGEAHLRVDDPPPSPRRALRTPRRHPPRLCHPRRGPHLPRLNQKVLLGVLIPRVGSRGRAALPAVAPP